MKVRAHHERFAAARCDVVFVAHDEPELLRRTLLAELEPLPFPVLVDRDRDAYRAWGCRRARWWEVLLDPRVWRQYLHLLRDEGERIRGHGRDILQLGGDFVVDRDETLRYARPQRFDDRPAIGDLLRVVNSA